MFWYSQRSELNMFTSRKHAPYYSFLKAFLGLFILCVALASAFTLFQQMKSASLERLALLNELTVEKLKAPLLEGELSGVEGILKQVYRQHDLANVRLHGVDGRVMVAHEDSGEQPLETLTYGGYYVWQWPMNISFQYAGMVLQNDRPLGFLILSANGDIGLLIWPVLLFFFGIVTVFMALRLRFPPATQRISFVSGKSRYSHAQPEPILIQEVEEKIQEKTSQLRVERDRAVASAEAKNNALADMSHEIRSSLHGIMSVLALLKKSRLAEEQVKLISAAEHAADALLVISNDVLDFAKIESGKIDFAKVEFDLRETIEECVALFIESARAKSIALHCYIPTTIRSRVKGDPTRLRQIITNLMSNGVKFTKTGEVNLFVSTVTRDADRQRLCFTIEDTGIGIKPTRIDDIFEMYVQADAKVSTEYGGSGVGLSICKKLVESQGGKIGVHSTPGLGTAFWFTLPFDLAEEHAFPASLALQNTKILQFSDCETCATIINQYLHDARVCNITSTRIEEITDQLAVNFHDYHDTEIILVDYESFHDNFESLLDVLEETFKDSAPRTFVMHWSGEADITMMSSRLNGFVGKPLSFLSFRKQLVGLDDVLPADGKEDTTQLTGRVLLVDDEEINRHVGKRILEKIGCKVDVAADGEKTLAMTAAFAYDIVLMDIHMPGLNGIEATRLMRAREEKESLRKMVIIALTANGLPTTKERCLAAGMDGFIVKPIQLEQMVEIIGRWLPVSCSGGVELKDSDHYQVNEVFRADEQVWDRQRALKYLGGDEELLVELMRMFVGKKDDLLAKIKEAMDEQDAEEACCAAHAFKGAVNHFAAERCRQLAQMIETRASEGLLEGLAVNYGKLVSAADTLEEELRQIIKLSD